jgi:hypothetical protein
MIRSLPLILLLTSVVVADDKKAPPLPADWYGTWAGKLAMTDRTGMTTEIPLTLKVEPIKGTDEVTWVATYGEGEKKAVKDYKLVPAGKPGRFRIDEQNGSPLDTNSATGYSGSR